MEYVCLKKYYEDVLEDIKEEEGAYPIVATTSAKKWNMKKTSSRKLENSYFHIGQKRT